MTRQLSRGQAAGLGIVVLTALGMAAWVLFALDQRRGLGNDAFHVQAGFTDIAGVEVGTRVRIQGIDAGEVESILLPDLPGQEVQLRLRLAGKLRHLVTSDARVQIAGENLLAGKIVRILPGNPQSSPVEDGAILTAVSSPELAETVTQTATRLARVLTEVDSAVQDFRQGQGSIGTIALDLAQSSAKLTRILSRVDGALADIEQGKGTLGLLLKDDTIFKELADTLGEVKSAVTEIRAGEGTVGMLVRNNEAYAEAMLSLQDVRKMVAAVKQNADALKALPVVRSYIVDAHKELVRPECTRFVRWFPENKLFDPGRAVLTPAGRKILDEAAPWLGSHKEPGSEVVIAAYASQAGNAEVAQTITQKQSEAVCDYLRGTHQVHRTGWWWWNTRPVRPIGVGVNPPPLPGHENLPPARIELVVFVPGT